MQFSRLVKTDMALREINSEEGKKKIANIPFGRIANISELTSVVGYLASNDASYITGQTINVNGECILDSSLLIIEQE